MTTDIKQLRGTERLIRLDCLFDGKPGCVCSHCEASDTIARLAAERDRLAGEVEQASGREQRALLQRDCSTKEAEAWREERDRLAGEVERLRNLLKHAELDCHKARFALQTIGESTVPDQPASSGLTELEHVQHHHTQIRRLAIMTLRPEAIGIYEAPRREADEIRVRGVGRDLFEPRSVRVALTERPTDDEIKSIHNWMRGWKL